MKNRKMIITESGKSKTKLFAILGLCASFACTLTAGAAAIPVNAMGTSSAATVAELWGDGQFNKSAVSDLLTKTTGKASYDDALSYLNSQEGSVLTSTNINTLNDGKDVVVDFGGYKWTVTYVSKDKNGNMIATLWYADTETASEFSYDWRTDGTISNLPTPVNGTNTYNRFSNHYGGSYLRAVTLGNGGSYWQSTGTTVKIDTAVTEQTASAEEIKASQFYNFAQGELSNYLVTPNSIVWQQSEMAYPSSAVQYRSLNESLITETTSWITTRHEVSQQDELYFQWGNDKVWIPSISEVGFGTTGSTNFDGIWETTANQRASACIEPDRPYTWLRTGGSGTAHSAYALDESGNAGTLGSTHLRNGVRPAIHLNLTKAITSYDGEIYDADALAELWNDAVQQSLDNNGAQVTFTLPCNWFAKKDDTYTTSFGEGIGFDSGRIDVPEGANIKLDLNGHIIDRGLASAVERGLVIRVVGDLEIIDTTTNQMGKITGGYSSTHGGGIIVYGGNLTLTSGNITGNRTYNSAETGAGGGVFVQANSTIAGTPVGSFIMNGGKIYGNYTNLNGGGVCVYNTGSSFTMNGGEIYNNESKASGGGVCMGSGALGYFNGGKIYGNTTNSNGGGIYCGGAEIVVVGTEISDNFAVSNGGGIGATNGTKITIESGTIANNTANATAGGVYISASSLEINDGKIYGNESPRGGGIYMTGSTLTINNGTISDNTATLHGGGIYSYLNSILTMNGGEISGNNAGSVGGGLYAAISGSDESILTINDGEISGNSAGSAGGGARVEFGGASDKFTMNGGKICNNVTEQSGGGISITGSGIFTMNGGEISGNTALNTDALSTGTGGGGVFANSDSTFIMNGGLISNNTCASRGAGVYAGTGTTMELNGGEISGNYGSAHGGGIYNFHSIFTMTGGSIKNNSTNGGAGGLHIYQGTTNISGGIITGNVAATSKGSTSGAGMYLYAADAINISGGMIYGNTTVSGEANNISIVDNSKINITGTLAGGAAGKTTYIGITMNTVGVFTAGYGYGSGSQNSNHPATYFFSDDNGYEVALSGTEATLVAKTHASVSLIWQYSADGTNWTNMDAPYFSVPYTGSAYHYRAMNGSTSVASGTVTAVGSHPLVLNNTNNQYINPVLNFEITPIEIIWKYSTDGGNTWFDFEETTIAYTGLTYTVGAFDSNGNRITLATQPSGAIKNANKYEFTVNNTAGNYASEAFTFTIVIRHLVAEWEYTGAASGTVWNYDGLTHTPVAVLQGVSHEQAGNLPLGYAYEVRGGSAGTSAPKDAGFYTVTITILDENNRPLNDPNITLSGGTTTFTIKPVTLSVVWEDENGTTVDEAEYDYNGKGHTVTAKLNGLLPADSVDPVISYYDGSAKLSSAPVNKGVYTAKAALPANCYNYVLDYEFSCQININSVEISVEWTGNAAEKGAFTWEFYGYHTNLGVLRAPVATLNNPVEGANVAYTVEYAAVASDGTVGAYSATIPVNAGKYVARLKITDTYGNYTLSGETQEFEITKLGVELVWKDGANVLTPDADGFVKWEYDGNPHNVTPGIDMVPVYKDGVLGVILTAVRTDSNGALTDVGTALAAGALDPDDAFNANFYIKGNATQNYKVYKKVLSVAQWTDAEGNIYSTGDKPRYDHGTITGANGPAFTVTAVGAGTTVLNLGTVTYSASFTGEWPVDEINGYVATAKLSANDYKNYEFEEGSDSTTLTFLVRSVSGSKENITVTWVVFTGANTYEKITSGYAFTYNGAQQFPRALYVKTDGTYEELEMSSTGKGTDAGSYTVRLLPSSKYNISDADFTFDYEIKPVDVTISWQDGENLTTQTFSYVFNGAEQKPFAKVSGNGTLDCPVTVAGEINAGEYTAVAQVSKNFNITSGATQAYKITKLQLNSTLITWDYDTDNALTNSQNVRYWIYDGNEHAPKAYILLSTLNNLRIDLVITGATSAIGTHTVYAMLDSENPVHANFSITGAAQSSFEIVRVPVTTVIWEDGAGNASTNGATVLTFTYNGKPQVPTAYFMNGTTKVSLNVAGAMTDAGKYTAYITDDFDYGTTVPPQCNFEIKPVEVTVVWSDTKTTYNGLTQYPTAALQDGAGNPFEGVDGNPLALNTDYTVTGFDGAGTYTAEIKFINKNYTYAGTTGKTSFTVESVDISSLVQTTDWSAKDKTPDATSGLYEWSYDAKDHAPELSLTYRLDGDLVAFTFAYTGVSSTVGTHTVTAYISKAEWRGQDISANFNFSAEINYVINPFEITLKWDFAGEGATEDTENGVWYWNYDGQEHAPAVTYTDWAGATKTLTVFGGATNARATAYTATVDAPANCVFASTETGRHDFEIRKGSISVVWVYSDNEGTDGAAPYWTYDGKPHGVTAYIADAQGNPTSAKLNEVLYTNAGSYTATAAQSDENYTITSGATFNFIIKEKEVYIKWLGVDGSATDFAWDYNGQPHKPTAVLCEADGTVILGADGKAIAVSVTGEMTDAGANHIAEAVDTFVNYAFHASASITQKYEIKPQSVVNLGFKWTADGAVKTNDGTYDVYTYPYSGKTISPKPETSNDLAFNTVINVYNADGTLGAVVQSIEEVGDYLITITPVNGNYTVPAGLGSVRVTVTAFKAEVVWSTEKLVYNGTAQAPTAYYVDAQGQQIPLDVTGAMTDAGKEYSATAKFRGTAPDNYVLDGATTKFDIEQLEIPVSWTFAGATLNGNTNAYEWNYDGSAHRPEHTVDTSVILAADKNGVTLGYEITKTGATGTLTSVKDAGEYKIKLVLSGAASANYKFESSEQTFKILKQTLTVTAQDATVAYGQNAPAYSAVITGWVGNEKDTLEASVFAVQASWLKCAYTNRSVPGTYTIGLVQSVLDGLLPNYDVLLQNGTLTVTPAERTVIWKGDLNDLGAYYDGMEYKPTAYYVDGGENIPLEIVYATYNEATGEYTEITDSSYRAVDAGTYYVMAKTSGIAVNLANSAIDYKIYKREITVIIENKLSVYGEPNKTLTYRYGEDGLQPLPADDLKIELNCDILNEANYVNGFMNAGEYDITASWDSAAFDSNYSLTFTNEDGSANKGVYTVSKAQIKVTKANEAFSNEEFTSIVSLIGDGNAMFIKLGDTSVDENGLTQYKFIQYNGYQNATQVTVHYSRKYNIGSIETGLTPVPFAPEDLANNNYQTYQFDGMWDIGCYAYNYYIEIPNHETLYGTWTVLMLPESQVVRVEFVKDYEVEYGKAVSENLAKELLEGGYININISTDRFLQTATATVSDGRGGYVNASTGVGRYTIEIEITNTDANTQLLVTYHNDFGAEDTNVGRYHIKPKKLTVDWGNLEFDHDGTLKLPAPNVYGFVTADTLVLENIKTRADGTSYEYTAYTVTDNGVEVTIIVAARGNFMDVGGHTLLVTVENSNYEIELLNASASVSIKGDDVTVQDGLPDWLMWVLIAAAIVVAILIIVIIIVVKRKRAAMEDDDGFYDDLPTEE